MVSLFQPLQPPIHDSLTGAAMRPELDGLDCSRAYHAPDRVLLLGDRLLTGGTEFWNYLAMLPVADYGSTRWRS